MSGYFTRPLPAHIAAYAAVAIMFVQGADFLGGSGAVTITLFVQTMAIALYGLAWLRRKKAFFPATATLVVLSLLGPLYTLGMFSLYVFETYENPFIQAVPPIAACICLVYMWLAFSPPKPGTPTGGE